MSRLKPAFKLIPIVLIISVFLTACEIPDITEFTTQSAEMTRGIRTGVKDTESLIKTASDREDLYSAETIASLRKDLKDYQNGIKPTVAALDALDAYLGALNALSKANQKSGENASAVVTSVTNLVSAVSGLTFASSAVNVATGLLTLAEEFRTARDFKKRVNLATEIVEGIHPSKDANRKPIKDKNGQVIYLRTCTEDAGDKIVDLSKAIKIIVDPILSHLTEDQLKTLKPLAPEVKRAQLDSWGKFGPGQYATITAAESTIASYGCGVIDFIKFNVNDLKEINQAISKSIYDNIRDNNRTVSGTYESIRAVRKNIRDELESLFVAKKLIPQINELVVTQEAQDKIVDEKISLKATIDNLFTLDPTLKSSVIKSITECDANCGHMLNVLNTNMPLDCDDACLSGFKLLLANDANGTTDSQFDESTARILIILDSKHDQLTEQDKKYAADLERLKPDFDALTAELKAVTDKRDQLDRLLTTSLTALTAWTESHANLRVALNTKKPLTVAKLKSEVLEILEIIHPLVD